MVIDQSQIQQSGYSSTVELGREITDRDVVLIFCPCLSLSLSLSLSLIQDQLEPEQAGCI
jgi:hypothetical protein